MTSARHGSHRRPPSGRTTSSRRAASAVNVVANSSPVARTTATIASHRGRRIAKSTLSGENGSSTPSVPTRMTPLTRPGRSGGPREPAPHDEVAERADQAAEHADEEQEGDRPADRDLADALAGFGQPALDPSAGRRREEPHDEPSAQPEHEDAGQHAGRGHRAERPHGVGEHAEPVVRRLATAPQRQVPPPPAHQPGEHEARPHRGPPPRRSPPRMTRQTCAGRRAGDNRCAHGYRGKRDFEQLEVVRAGDESVVQPGRDGHRIIGAEPHVGSSVDAQRGRPGGDEPEAQLGVVTAPRRRRAVGDRPGPGAPRRDRRWLRRCRSRAPRTRPIATAPKRRQGAVPDERLAVEGPLGTELGRRQREVVVDVGGMLGRARHLDHLQPGRALQHTVADAARLQHAVASLQDERLALVLVDDAHPTPAAVDDLEADAVVVDVVRHRSGVGDRDVRGDEPASLAPREQVPVVHRGPSDTAGVAVGGRRQLEAGGQRWQDQHRLGRREFDDRAVRRLDRRAVALAQLIARHPEPARPSGVVPFQSEAQPVPGDDGDPRLIGGHDRVEPEPEPVREEGERRFEVGARHHHLPGGRRVGSGGRAAPRSPYRSPNRDQRWWPARDEATGRRRRRGARRPRGRARRGR